MNEPETIFVRLPDEAVETYRPVQAEAIRSGVYRILEQPYSSTDELWEFVPGDVVLCHWVRDAHGGPFLLAIDKVGAK
jgi:hypothetical protein